MAFDGKRKTLPSSRWGDVIDLLEETHWSYAEYLDAPQELVDEWRIRLSARREVEAAHARKREMEAQRNKMRSR